MHSDAQDCDRRSAVPGSSSRRKCANESREGLFLRGGTLLPILPQHNGRDYFREDGRRVAAGILGCELVYQNPRFTRETLARYFSSETFIRDPADLDDLIGYSNYLEWDESYRRTAAFRLARITRLHPPPGRLVEIGSATGSFLSEARARGFIVSGLDISSRFAEMARNRHGLDIEIGFVEENQLPQNHFDVICNFGGIACWRDPLAALNNIHQALKIG